MAKSIKSGGGRMKSRTIMPTGGKGAAKPSFPNEGLPSNVIADKQANLIFGGATAVSAVLVLGGIFWSVAFAVSGWNSQPTNWFSIVGGVVGIVALAFVARSFVWMSLFGAIMYAQKNGAWDAQKTLCARAMGLKKLIPGGATTAALLLVQGYISRGEMDETIRVGQQQYEEFGNDPKQQQNLAPIYSALGMAFTMRGAWRDSTMWNERALTAFAQLLDQFKNKKGMVAKMAGAQSDQFVKDLLSQMALVSFNTGTAYHNMGNNRSAKEYLRKAVEYANQAPPSAENSQILDTSKELLRRLKHA